MASRTFTVFQDAPTAETVNTKITTSKGVGTRSSTHQESSVPNDSTPTDKENLNPVTGERVGTSASSKKRKTNVLVAKPPIPLSSKKVKSLKETNNPHPQSKKRKATSEAEKSKVVAKKEGKVSVPPRKATRRVARKIPELPRLEEEATGTSQDTERIQALIGSRCYELTVQPLVDVTRAYEAIESKQNNLVPTPGKAKIRKATSVDPEIHDFLSQTIGPQPSNSISRAHSSEPTESRKFSASECKQIYAAFTFSSPSPTSQRFKSLSRSGSLELA